MTDAYAKAGVSQNEADDAVGALVAALARSAPAESRQALKSGHYANVIRLGAETGHRHHHRRRRHEARRSPSSSAAGTRSGSTASR